MRITGGDQGQSGWNSQPQEQHQSQGQGSSGPAQVDGGAQAQTVAALQGQGNGQQAPQGNGQGQAQGQAQPQGQRNEFLEGILGEVDPAHRPIVEPYLGRWNAGVTRRFQELHGQLQPYQELGADPETLATALALMEQIDNDPQGVIALLQEAIAGDGQGQPQGQQQPQGLGNPQAPEGQPPPTAIPPELEERLGTFETVLEHIAQQILGQQQTEQQQAEDAELEQYLDLLKQEKGDFDEDYVLAKMYAGMDGAAAVDAYHQAIQAQVNQRARTPNVPPILGGGGAVPQEGKSVTNASRNETKSLVANILAASQNS